MKHGFIDEYSDLDSFVHRLDPRTKILATLAFILAVMVTPPLPCHTFAPYLALIVALTLLAKLPILYVLKRSSVVLPFVLMMAAFIPFYKQGEVAGSYNIRLWQLSVTYGGLAILWNTLAKSWLSALSMILLSSTTRFPDLLKGLERLGVPKVMVMILSFMYRYIFVLVDEAMRMQQARDSRNFGGGWAWQAKTIGNMIGTLFVRTYERGERTYGAMVARGFDGHIRTLSDLRFRRADLCFGVAFLFALVLIAFLQLTRSLAVF